MQVSPEHVGIAAGKEKEKIKGGANRLFCASGNRGFVMYDGHAVSLW